MLPAKKTPTRRKGLGFTLIELMVVVSIIGVLAAIALPKFAELIRKSIEGATKGSLGAIRSTLNIYYADMEGQFPNHLSSVTVNGKYLSTLPQAKAPYYHGGSLTEYQTAFVTNPNPSPPPAALTTVLNGDLGGWNYVVMTEKITVNCTHTDSKGTVWTSY